jgi:prepilin-type N-terminal cleavage/methylation domain-containing protein
VHRSRKAYTFAELLIVLVIIGSLMFFALPKFAGLVERSQLSAAREEISAAIATARAAAVQKGRTATVVFSGNRMWVNVVSANGASTSTVVPTKEFSSLYNVSVVAANDTAITYDMRGFARLASSQKFRILGSSRSDSVCVTAAGQIMRRGCSL